MSKQKEVDPYVVQNSKFRDYLNNKLSGRYVSDDGEGSEDRLIFDFPKSTPNEFGGIFDEKWFNDMERDLDHSDSHGVEGNPGGIVTRHNGYIDDKGEFYRLYDITQYILDV
jgi:hypothetical protein